MTDESTSITRRGYLRATGLTGTAGLAGFAGCTTSLSGGSSDTIVIGGTIPLTGSFSSLGKDLERGYKLGAKHMNEQLDKKVELILKDDESDPKKVREKLQQITSNNDVKMLWGSFSSLLVTAGSAYAENQGVPFLGIAFAYMAPHMKQGYEWTFSPFPKSRDVARSTKGVLSLIPEGERPKNVGIWEPNSGWGAEQAQYWEDELKNAGYNIVMRQKFSIGAKDFSSMISQAKSNNVEILLSNPTPPGAITAMKQMKSNNFAPKVLKFVRGADPSAWWSALGETGEFAMMCPGWVPGLTGNDNAKMREAYVNEYDHPSGKLLPVQVGTSYNLTQVATQALSNAESTDPEAIRDVLRSQKFHTVIGDFGFEKNGLPMSGQLTAPTGQWWNGGQHLAFPNTDAEAAIDFKYPLTPWGER